MSTDRDRPDSFFEEVKKSHIEIFLHIRLATTRNDQINRPNRSAYKNKAETTQGRNNPASFLAVPHSTVPESRI